MLIFRNSPNAEADFQSLSPEELQANIEKWNQWIAGIAAQGKLGSTEGLLPQGKVLTDGGKVVTDGPYAEGKEIVGGYMVLSASNFDEAVEMARHCPIFADGGLVEVRQVQNFG